MEDKALIFPLLAIVLLSSQTQALATNSSTYRNFIKTKCNITTHPSLCVKTLMPHASSVKTNPKILCKEALKVAVKGARRASHIFWNLRNQEGISRYEAVAIKDCVEAVKSSVYDLKRSIKTIGRLSGAEDKESELHINTAITYASAALTNAETCIDGFSESEEEVNPNVKMLVERSITVIKTLASNALALITQLKF